MEQQIKSVKIDKGFLEKLFRDESKFNRKYSVNIVEIGNYNDFGIEIRCGEDIICSKFIRLGAIEFKKIEDREAYIAKELDGLFQGMIEYIVINGIEHIRKLTEEFKRNKSDRN